MPAGMLAYRLNLREILVAGAEFYRAAGAEPVSAVIHYKPGRSHVAGAPDHFAATVDGWVTYPCKAGG